MAVRNGRTGTSSGARMRQRSSLVVVHLDRSVEGDSVNLMVSLFKIVMGVGIAAIWTIDISGSTEVDRRNGLLRAHHLLSGALTVAVS